MANRSSAHRRSSSAGAAEAARKASPFSAADLLLLDELHAHLPIALLVNDAETLEIRHANAALVPFADPARTLKRAVGSRNEEHDPQSGASELASVLEEVAATGTPRHLPAFRHDFLGQGTRWWSANLNRIETEDWGRVVVTLAVDLTDQVGARQLIEEREHRSVALRQRMAAVPGNDLVSSLQHVTDALALAVSAHVAVVHLRDADAELHLVAATGLRPVETRQLALEPLEARQVDAMIAGGHHPLLTSLGLRWVEIRWLDRGGHRIGTMLIGSRSERRLDEADRSIFEAAAAQLSASLAGVRRSRGFLRSRSLEMARADAREAPDGRALVHGLRPRELSILRLYGEGFKTHQIAELLVLSVHTVRTHVRNARRRLGVSSRREALDIINAEIGPLA